MSKEFQIRDGNLIASFDLENEDGDVDFCKLLKVSKGVADEIGMFVDYVATNKIIKEQSKQIADLEAKLAESEERYKKAYREGLLQKQFDKDMKIDQLKQQLARSRNANDDLKNKLNKTREELEIANNQILFDNTEFEKLNKQLAEKEKEIENLEQRISDKSTALYGAELMARDVQWHLEKQIHELKQANHDKISFAVEQLEKVKEFCNNPLIQNVYGNIPEFRIENYIDNQINELKEKK